MSLILVLNAGSTSLKYKLFDYQTLKVVKKESFENLPTSGDAHLSAVVSVLKQIGNLTDIKIVGHRIVHGGTEFQKPTLLDDKNLKNLAKYSSLAPLHNPYNLKVAQLARVYLNDIPHVGCFDTSFFIDLPLQAKLYAIPLEYYRKYNIQRFGFHGISHQYVANQAAKMLKKNLNKINLITCHLGGGCSIAAIKKGKAIDTSMGFTPLEGLVMMTRSGDIDPGLINYFNKECDLSMDQINDLLNYESGIKGLFGTSNFRELLKAAKRGDKKAKLAFEIFIYRIQKYISSYFGILGNADAIVFTGAIGVGDVYTRKNICQGLKLIKSAKILAIETDEELAIAQECQKILK